MNVGRFGFGFVCLTACSPPSSACTGSFPNVCNGPANDSNISLEPPDTLRRSRMVIFVAPSLVPTLSALVSVEVGDPLGLLEERIAALSRWCQLSAPPVPGQDWTSSMLPCSSSSVSSLPDCRSTHRDSPARHRLLPLLPIRRVAS